MTDLALRWHFNGCVLDESTLQLIVRGATAELERKPLEVLRYLLRHAGEVVTKDEVLEAVWPGRILSDTVLAKAISRLREVLGAAASETVKTVHGYGYRLVAEVRVESIGAAVTRAPALGLKAGEHPPLRPNWVLHDHLDSGGRGEVWRVRHEKTGELRVFKFALDDGALTTLKREITLHRLLRQQLGEDAAFVHVLDWNLQETPFFIELEHVAAGNLADWAAAQGGLKSLPLVQRIALAVQIAEALSLAHGVGVLHKDLKPGNVLVDGTGAAPRLLLADFGSGAVVEPSQLDALGITRMGLTQLLSGDDTSGTPLYLAPEVLAGQPSTVKSDLYALGVLLYQLIVGDFRKPLSPGWERDIEDLMLREDIAIAADGSPSQRLGDAAQLAERLRTLDARRAARAAQDAARAHIELARQENERLKARRTGLVIAVLVLLIGVATSLWLYRKAEAQRQLAEAASVSAHEAAETARLVNAFMTGDVFGAVDLNLNRLPDLTVKQLLDQAATKVDVRLKDRPLAAAQIHVALGSAYYDLQQYAAASQQIKAAAALALPLLDTDPAGAVQVFAAIGIGPNTKPAKLPWRRLLTLATQYYGSGSREEIGVLFGWSIIRQQTGELKESQQQLEAYAATHPELPPALRYFVESLLADALGRQGFFVAAQAPLQRALDPATAAAAGRAVNGFQQSTLTLSYGFQGLRDLVSTQADKALETILRNADPGSNQHLFVLSFNGWAYAEAGQIDEGLKRTAEAEAGCAAANKPCEGNGYFMGIARGRTLLLAGQLAAAITTLQQALAGIPPFIPAEDPWRLLGTVWLGQAELAAGDVKAAESSLAAVNLKAFDHLSPNSLMHGELALLRARLAAGKADASAAQREWLQVAASMALVRGPQHPLTLAALRQHAAAAAEPLAAKPQNR